MSAKAVAVFTRHPSPGKVKTRLAAKIGDGAACQFYKNCAENVLLELQKCRDVSVHLFVAETSELDKVGSWMRTVGMGPRIMGQVQSQNLGDRIFHALKHLKLSGFAKVAAVATDIPDITHSIIDRGLALLDRYDVVLGPAEDGGFYFLGVQEVTKELFEVRAQTCRGGQGLCTGSAVEYLYCLPSMVVNAQKLHLRVAPSQSLPIVADIDTFEDLCSWVGHSEEAEAASVVERALTRLCPLQNS